MAARAGLSALCGLALLIGVGCSRPRQAPGKPWLRPRASSPFVCEGSSCRQSHPRLPDTGEWRCAERGGVVWCSGGEPAAGVVSGPPDVAFRCGARFGQHAPERVCIDEQPELPAGLREPYRCAFEQEQGILRVCKPGPVAREARLPRTALAACWLPRDCASGECERGACRCTSDSECERGRCRDGFCAEARP